MAYEVTPEGRADPVPGTEVPEGNDPDDNDPDRLAPGGLISLEDIRAPWSRPHRTEDGR